MTRTEIKAKADQYRKMACNSTSESDRATLLRKARNYYEDLGMTGMARFCERWMGR